MTKSTQRPSGTVPDPPALPRPDGPFPQDFGRYRLLERLGGGGMGTVYRAHDTKLDRQVAVKVPHARLLEASDILPRFYQEARAAARLLCHPHLCPVLDVGDCENVHYLTMPFIAGEPLSRTMPTDIPAITRLVQQLARGMADAHDKKVVHRDLKPANIMMTVAGTPVITDFGLALRLDLTDERVTVDGTTLGTPAYMPPEQVTGDLSLVGPASDIYSLGVILFQLLTGRLPFAQKRVVDLFDAIRYDPPPPPTSQRPGLDRRWDDICLRALAKQPEDRFPDMRAFAEAVGGQELAGCVGGQAGFTDEVGRFGPPTLPTDSRRVLPSTILSPQPSPQGMPRFPREAVRFSFVGYGTSAPETVKDRLFLDVGNDLRPGVIDHHQLDAFTGSTTGLVLAHPKLVDESARSLSPQGPFTIVLHEHPDLDGVAAVYLALSRLTNGDFPASAEALASYVDRVDQGSMGLSLAQPYSLYTAYLQLANRHAHSPANAPQQRWQTLVQDGLKLIEFVLAEMAAQGASLPAVDAFACSELFTAKDRAAVDTDMLRYLRKLQDPKCHARIVPLQLPGPFGGKSPAAALLVRDVQNGDDPERCAYFKDWARSDANRAGNGRGFIALSVFMSEGPSQKRRCILSVPPDCYVTLRGLGAKLDEAESKRRRELFGEDDRVVDPATGQKLTPRSGFTNADPWYDGRAHHYTIVDSPRGGTMLTAEEIEGMFLEFGGCLR